MSVRNWHFATAVGIAMCFLIEAVYCMTWIWTLHRVHKKSKSPIEEDNIWATFTATLTMTVSREPKPGHAPKRLGVRFGDPLTRTRS